MNNELIIIIPGITMLLYENPGIIHATTTTTFFAVNLHGAVCVVNSAINDIIAHSKRFSIVLLRLHLKSYLIPID